MTGDRGDPARLSRRTGRPQRGPAGDNARTLAAYEARASTYAEQTSGPLSRGVLAWLATLDRLAPAGRVLEIGSAGGRDARALEALGRRVRRTDATRAFVDLLRSQGHDATVLDVLTDDLGGPYAAVLADAVFLHFTPRQLRTVLDRVGHALDAGGVLGFTVKEGDGSEWSDVGLGLPRFFQYWRPGALRSLVEQQGWHVLDVTLDRGSQWTWICVLATPTRRVPDPRTAPGIGIGSAEWT